MFYHFFEAEKICLNVFIAINHCSLLYLYHIGTNILKICHSKLKAKGSIMESLVVSKYFGE